MKLSNAKIFLDGRFVPGGIRFSNVIEDVGPQVTGGTDLNGCYVIPGLIDIHTHGETGMVSARCPGTTPQAASRPGAPPP